MHSEIVGQNHFISESLGEKKEKIGSIKVQERNNSTNLKREMTAYKCLFTNKTRKVLSFVSFLFLIGETFQLLPEFLMASLLIIVSCFTSAVWILFASAPWSSPVWKPYLSHFTKPISFRVIEKKIRF